MRLSTLALGGALALAAALTAGPATAVAQETGSVYVVHGIPDTPVDVYVDGKRAIDDFKPISEQGPVELPAGSHTVAIFPADAQDGSGEPLLSAKAQVPAGGNVTLVAYLDADTMLAGDRTASLDAELKDAVRQDFGSMFLAFNASIVKHQRMQVAVAGVKYIGDSDARFHTQPLNFAHQTRQRSPRDDAILYNIIR